MNQAVPTKHAVDEDEISDSLMRYRGRPGRFPLREIDVEWLVRRVKHSPFKPSVTRWVVLKPACRNPAFALCQSQKHLLKLPFILLQLLAVRLGPAFSLVARIHAVVPRLVIRDLRLTHQLGDPRPISRFRRSKGPFQERPQSVGCIGITSVLVRNSKLAKRA